MAHAVAHPKCPFNSWTACEKARREALGKCESMTANQVTPTQCRQWASSIVDGHPICNMHAESLLLRQHAARVKAEKDAGLLANIEAYMAFTATHPSVWDKMPEHAGRS